MDFCKLINDYCKVTKSQLNADTLSSKETVSGLKDCSNKLCKFRGKEGCLLVK